jgi:hypothetical protein
MSYLKEDDDINTINSKIGEDTLHLEHEIF